MGASSCLNGVVIHYDIFFEFLLYAAAIQCLKRKRLYEQQIEQLGNFQLRIHDQVCECTLNLAVATNVF